MPSRGIVRVLAGPAQLGRAAADHFLARAITAEERGERFSVALAGGSTPRALYTLLADETGPYRARVPWSRVHLFQSDERHVPPDHADSNYRMASEAMLAPLLSSHLLPEENIHRIEAENPDAAAAATAYERGIREWFGLTGRRLPRFDLVLLGMGDDGHTASLFPDSKALFEDRHLVVATRIEKLHSMRITVTFPLINHAASVVIMVSGRGKATTLRALVEPGSENQRFPVELVEPIDGELLWLLDREAASLL